MMANQQQEEKRSEHVSRFIWIVTRLIMNKTVIYG
jgi:hypothetical protein